MAHILIAIFCLDEAEAVGRVIDGLRETFRQGNLTARIIVIDDCSTDNSVEIARSKSVEVIEKERTRGLADSFDIALETFLRDKSAKALLTMDGDDQFDANDAPRIVQPILYSNADLVTGSRFTIGSKRINIPKTKLLGNKVLAMLMRPILSAKLTDVACGYRAYSPRAATLLSIDRSLREGKFTYTHDVLMQTSSAGLSIREVPIGVRYFDGRKSRVASNVFRYGTRALRILTQASREMFPLQFYGLLSILSFFSGAIFSLVFLNHFYTTGRFLGALAWGLTGSFMLILSLLFAMTALLLDSNRKLTNLVKKSALFHAELQLRNLDHLNGFVEMVE